MEYKSEDNPCMRFLLEKRIVCNFIIRKMRKHYLEDTEDLGLPHHVEDLFHI